MVRDIVLLSCLFAAVNWTRGGSLSTRREALELEVPSANRDAVESGVPSTRSLWRVPLVKIGSSDLTTPEILYTVSEPLRFPTWP